MAEEYCWAMTDSCCDPLGSSVFGVWISVGIPCVHTELTMYDNCDLHKIQLAADFPEGNCYINRGVSLLFPYIT